MVRQQQINNICAPCRGFVKARYIPLQIAFAIRDAARDRDPLRALAEYDRGIAEGIDMKPDSYASLLYLCAGGDGWEARARARADDPE